MANMGHAMTSPTSVNPRGFTLIEMLVVMGILVLLAGILMPATMRVMRAAERTRTAAILQTISVGLEAYHNDHQQYPPIPAAGMGPAMLGRALLAPGPAIPNTIDPATYNGANTYNYGDVVQDGSGDTFVCISATATSVATSDTTRWQPIHHADGADGFGFKTRSVQGKTYAYLNPERLKLRGYAILDPADNPILYYLARPGKPDLAATNGFIAATGTPLYNSNHSPLSPQALLSQDSFRHFMGDLSRNGRIDSGETPAYTGPYILWAAGPDGTYGVTDFAPGTVARWDDVTNFK